MKDAQKFETRFDIIFRPIFFWGVSALEVSLIIYTLFMEFVRGNGPSLLSTVLPLSVVILIMWAILAALISLLIIAIRNRKNRKGLR